MSDDGTLVYGSEQEILKWFKQFLKQSSSSFSTSASYFEKYYNKCVHDLIYLPFKHIKKDETGGQLDSIYLDDIENFRSTSSYSNVLELMKSNSQFLSDVVNKGIVSSKVAEAVVSLPIEKLKRMNCEEVTLLMTDPYYLNYVNSGTLDEILRDKKFKDERIDEALVPLLKVHRFNNLEVKYAHTARVVYLTDLEVKQLGVDNDLVKSILYTGALFHDVGRFYQGAFYNSYNEADLRKVEANSDNSTLANDHAEAGYYYSLLDMINLNVLGVSTNADLIAHAIAAMVVKKHQKSNAQLANYDKMISDFNFSESINDKMLDFVLNCYSKAERFEGGLHGRFKKIIPGDAEAMRISFTDSMLNMISAYTGDANLEGVRDVIYGLFNYETPNLILDDECVSILRHSLNGKSLEEFDKKVLAGDKIMLSPEYNSIIRKYRLGNLLESKNISSSVLEEFLTTLIRVGDNSDYYAQYDIVSLMDNVFESTSKGENYQGIELDEEVAKVVRMSLNLVMDMDKLDILVQRAIKRYPGWKPNCVTVKALTHNDGVSVDETFLDVLENQFQVNLNFNDDGKIILDENLIDIIKYNTNINSDFKKKFGDNFDFSSLKPGVIPTVVDKAIRDSYDGKKVSVPYYLMEQVHPDLMERYKVEMDLILPTDLREKVFKEDKDREYAVGSNGMTTAFCLGDNASSLKSFVWQNSFPAVWWQLDQFVMTNMRSMESLRFMKNTRLLDRISEAYKSDDCPLEFGMFVDEIIDFTKEFVDLALEAKVNSNGDMIFGDQNEDGYSSIVLSDKDTMLKIRDEAVRRRNERLLQNSNVTEAEDVLDDNGTNGVQDKSEIDQMLGEYTEGTVLVSPVNNQTK